MPEDIMRDEFRAKLGIFCDTLSADEITKFIGIESDKSYLKDDHRGKTTIRQKENGWIIYSTIGRDAPLEDHVNNLLERINNHTDKIAEIARKPNVEVELGCTIWTGDRPSLFFTQKHISVLHKIGASIDIDLYVKSEETGTVE
jgi:hypothetical protein